MNFPSISEMANDVVNEVYNITMRMRSKWIVGYHPEKNEIFMYFVDQDELAWVFCRGGLDSVGFPEFMNFQDVEWLGYL